MHATTYTQVQEKITEFLADRINLRQLQDWIAPIAWTYSATSHSLAARLIHMLELRIAEYDAGHLPRAMFISELTDLAAGRFDRVQSSTSTKVLRNIDPPPFTPLSCVSSSEYALVCGKSSSR
jgi:hypothetical protein